MNRTVRILLWGGLGAVCACGPRQSKTVVHVKILDPNGRPLRAWVLVREMGGKFKVPADPEGEATVRLEQPGGYFFWTAGVQLASRNCTRASKRKGAGFRKNHARDPGGTRTPPGPPTTGCPAATACATGLRPRPTPWCASICSCNILPACRRIPWTRRTRLHPRGRRPARRGSDADAGKTLSRTAGRPVMPALRRRVSGRRHCYLADYSLRSELASRKRGRPRRLRNAFDAEARQVLQRRARRPGGEFGFGL